MHFNKSYENAKTKCIKSYENAIKILEYKKWTEVVLQGSYVGDVR